MPSTPYFEPDSSPFRDDDHAVSMNDYRDLFKAHPGGVAVVTARTAERLVGFTATSVISVAADPPLVGFSITNSSSSWPVIEAADKIAISFLAEDQADVATRFATHSINRFADGGWRYHPSGAVLIDRAHSWLYARITHRFFVSNARVTIARILQTATGLRPGYGPLLYANRTYQHLSPMRTTDST